MICHEFKGGIGTSSRSVSIDGSDYTVGALVQANYGSRSDLRVDGAAVGRRIGVDVVPSPWSEFDEAGSIIVIVATDAPLLPVQCRRLARRATVGLARVGGVGHNGSGDLFLAFATGNRLPKDRPMRELRMLDHDHIDPLFDATADAVEESILNALCVAETMTGYQGNAAHELPTDGLRDMVVS
jgi:D-aminopeptidase